MSQTIEEIRDTLTFILNMLKTIDTKLDRQEEDIKAYIERGLVNLDSNELIIAGLKCIYPVCITCFNDTVQSAMNFCAIFSFKKQRILPL